MFCSLKDIHKIQRAAGSPDDFEYIKNEVAQGRSRFINICGVYFVLRVDGNALTVVCAQGQNLKAASFWVIEIAKKLNLKEILFHTKRPALAKLLKHCNFKLYETLPSGYEVYKMVVN